MLLWQLLRFKPIQYQEHTWMTPVRYAASVDLLLGLVMVAFAIFEGLSDFFIFAATAFGIASVLYGTLAYFGRNQRSTDAFAAGLLAIVTVVNVGLWLTFR